MTGKGSGKGAGKPDLQAFLATLTWLTTLASIEETAEGPNRGASEATSSSSQQGTSRGASEATSSRQEPTVPEPEVEPGKPRWAPEAPEHEVVMQRGKLRGMAYWKVLLDQGCCKWIIQHINAMSSAPM